MRWKYYFLCLILIAGCKDKYMPKLNSSATGLLVVEGFINLNGTTNITMSRSSGIDSPVYIPEPGGHLEIQSEMGASYPLVENPGGQYESDGLNLDPGQQYRLYIKTAGGKEYLSDLSKAVITPPIDSLNWTVNNTGVSIYVTTHDDQVQPGYYQWQFEETWKYTAKYYSILEYQNGAIIDRPDSDNFFTCWRSDLATTIDISNTEKLTANVIYQYPVTQVLFSNSDKMVNRYSILVKQTEISKDFYEWNEKIKKNTEQLGSIFDAQPSETGGNIHCITDPNETVVGFIGTTTVTEKRIFIDRFDLPLNVQVFTGNESCFMDTTKTRPGEYYVPDAEQLEFYFKDGILEPIDWYYDPFKAGLFYSEAGCVDCRLKGGTTVKPAFWQ
jgi:hypothetical protein